VQHLKNSKLDNVTVLTATSTSGCGKQVFWWTYFHR